MPHPAAIAGWPLCMSPWKITCSKHQQSLDDFFLNLTNQLCIHLTRELLRKEIGIVFSPPEYCNHFIMLNTRIVILEGESEYFRQKTWSLCGNIIGKADGDEKDKDKYKGTRTKKRSKRTSTWWGRQMGRTWAENTTGHWGETSPQAKRHKPFNGQWLLSILSKFSLPWQFSLPW